jgi:hypothetical protein
MKESTRQKMSATKRAKFAQGITKQWNTGKHLSEKHRHKCSIALKGRIVSPETRAKISATQRGKPRTQRSNSGTLLKLYREGKITAWNKGLTKEMDARLTRSPDASRKCSVKLMGHPYWGPKHKTLEFRLKISKARRGHPVTEETRHKLSLAFKGRFVSEETRRKLSLSHIGKPNHQTPETLRKILMKVRQRPTQPEQQLIDFFQTHFPNQWKYVGNGSLLIGNPARNPDFVNCNGKMNLIEFNGVFRHTESEEIERAAFFAKHGYHTLYLHYADLKDLDLLATKIAEFSENSEQEKVSLSPISRA